MSCDDFLDLSPQGEISEKTLETSEEAVEGVVIGVYSVLNGQFGEITNAHRSSPSNWVYGDVASDDAYKGSSGISDGGDVHEIEVFDTKPNNQSILIKWKACYEGISRANKAINIISKFSGWDEDFQKQRLAEVRVLRGHYYFELKKIFNQIPYVDETYTPEQLKQVGNTELSSDEIWTRIENDFRFGAENLPLVQEEVGRVTRVSALAYLGKTHLFQNEWVEAKSAFDEVIANPGNHYLLADFEQVFLQNLNSEGAEFCAECLIDVQHSLDPSLPSSTPDVGATFGWDGNVGDRLSGLGGPYPRVYGFHKPSQNLVNAYKTDVNGYPLFNNFNRSPLEEGDPIDPRLDHTIGRPGIPFLNAGIYSTNWTRGVITYGPYAGKKQMYPANSGQVIDVPYYTNSENYCIIRLADVYLMKAECEIELGNLEVGMEYINMVRRRAKNGGYVENEDGTHAANYRIEEYLQPFNSYNQAIEALRMERRLELAMEGHRYFDLVRWGIVQDVMNEFFTSERNLRSYLVNSTFQPNKNEYFPIPESEIDISEGRFVQNTGY